MKSVLSIPDNIKLLQPGQVVTLSPADKDRYYDRVILDILRANPHGITVTEIEEATGFLARTIRAHLKGLVSRGEASSISRGKLTLYQSNGQIMDKPFTIESKNRLGTAYVVNKLKDSFGNLSYYIQEKELDAYRTLRVKGGVTIDAKDLKDFITEFHTYAMKDLASQSQNQKR